MGVLSSLLHPDSLRKRASRGNFPPSIRSARGVRSRCIFSPEVPTRGAKEWNAEPLEGSGRGPYRRLVATAVERS
jgi:hypothetical protein